MGSKPRLRRGSVPMEEEERKGDVSREMKVGAVFLAERGRERSELAPEVWVAMPKAGSLRYVARRTAKGGFGPLLYALAVQSGLSRAKQVVVLGDGAPWIWKLVADPMIAAGLPLVIVQPGLIYGPGDTSTVRTTFLHYLQRKLPVLPAKTAFSWTHVDDIARGHILAMEKGKAGESYIIAGPTHTFVDGMHLAEKITGVPTPRMQVAPPVMKMMAVTMSVVEKLVPVPEGYSSEYLRVSAGVTYIGSNAKAKRELGYSPRPLEEGLTTTLQHEMQLLGMK